MTLGSHSLPWRQTETKTCERTEVAARALQAMYGDSVSASRVDPGSKTASTSFGVKAVPPALPCRVDILVENGVAAPKSCRSPSKMRSPTAAGGLLRTGEASIVARITYHQPPLRLYWTEETKSKKTSLRTTILPISYDSSFFWETNLPAAPPCRRVIETKSG